MRNDPQSKYQPFPQVDIPDRAWPTRVITKPPVWLSTDLRDGNQALFEPMDRARKQELFRLLCKIGFKEIEVGFPSASQMDFDFVRHIITMGAVPDDVTIGVLTPARPELIARTIESLVGARRAIVHIYNAIAPVFREVVFRKTKADVVAMAVDAVCYAKSLTSAHPETDWVLEYSPETFSGAELAFSQEICEAVVRAWAPVVGEKIIINLPATVEMSTPNVFADQVEWMHRHLTCRDAVCLSVHPHNDRGTGIAAAELAQLAGAERVEGCLFGNGERSGNVDLAILALNLYTQGIDPGLDFSRLDEIASIVGRCTRLPLSPRHPYVGELVYTAFSGSHQDAIKKGLAAQDPRGFWNVPYLALDPKDVGRSYEAIIRVNSQSGKGGAGYLLETHYGVVLPRPMLIAVSRAVQEVADCTGREVSAADVWGVFAAKYLSDGAGFVYRGYELDEQDGHYHIRLFVDGAGRRVCWEGAGNGPLDAATRALPGGVRLRHYEERALTAGSPANALAIIELESHAGGEGVFGAAVAPSVLAAAFEALVRAWATLYEGDALRDRADGGEVFSAECAR